MELKMKQIRVARGLGQKEVAAAAGGMPVRRYGSYERGERKISLEDAAKVADVLECTLDELAGRDWPQPEYSDPRQARINEQYDDMNERGKEQAADSVENVYANAKNRKSAAVAELDPESAARRTA